MSFQRLFEHPDFCETRHWKRQQFAAQDIIFHEGDNNHEVYWIFSGTVRILADVGLEDGKRIKPGFFDLSEEDVFGELALFDRAPRSATVMAVTPCELAVMDGDQLMQFLAEHPEIASPLYKDIICTLVTRLRKTNRKLLSLLAWGLKTRGINEHL